MSWRRLEREEEDDEDDEDDEDEEDEDEVVDLGGGGCGRWTVVAEKDSWISS